MGVFGAIHDAGSNIFGYDTRAEADANEQREKASESGQRERDRLSERNEKLDGGEVGYDKPKISSTENWSGYSHEDIFRTNEDSISEGKADEIGRAWTELGKKLRERGPDFDRKLKSIIGNGWQGEAAEQAAKVGDPVREWMEGSGDAFELTGNRLKQAASGAGQAKQMIPEPKDHDWGRTAASAIPLGLVGGGADALAQMKERREAENQAREAMGRVYSPTLAEVDSGIPRFRKPDGTPVDPPDVPPQPPTDWGDGGGNPGDNGGGNPGDGSDGGDSRDPVLPPQPPSPTPEPPGPPVPDPPEHPSPNPSPPPKGPQGPPVGSESAWTTPTAPGGAGGAGAAGAGAGGSGMAGGVAAGAVGVPSGGSLGAGGRAGTGAVGGGAGPAGSPTGSATRSAGAGRPMMGGGMGGARGAQDAEDEEHERPSWLEENDDIWLNDMPKSAPPVLGE